MSDSFHISISNEQTVVHIPRGLGVHVQSLDLCRNQSPSSSGHFYLSANKVNDTSRQSGSKAWIISCQAISAIPRSIYLYSYIEEDSCKLPTNETTWCFQKKEISEELSVGSERGQHGRFDLELSMLSPGSTESSICSSRSKRWG